MNKKRTLAIKASIVACIMIVSFTVSAKSKFDSSSLRGVKASPVKISQEDASKNAADLSKAINDSVKKPAKKGLIYGTKKSVGVRISY